MRRFISSAASTCPIGSTTVRGEQRASSKSFEEVPGPGAFASIFDKNRTLFRSKRSISGYFEWLVNLHNRYGPVVKVNQGFGRGYVVHVFDPEDARHVFAADGRQPHIVPLQETTQRYREMKGMNPGLGNLNGDEWYRLRSSVQQVMMRPQAVHNSPKAFTANVSSPPPPLHRAEGHTKWLLIGCITYSTAPMLVYNLFNIARHPDVQDELRNEVNSVVGRSEEIDPAVLAKLPYLRACIKETFRLFPIGTEISRILQKDLILGGYRVPAGTPVDINTNVLMKTTALFDEPLRFNPKRCLRSVDRQYIHPFAFLPFGFGPRMCAGRRFAEQDLQVVLCRLVQHFRVSHGSSPIEQIYETLLLPKGCCHFQFEAL